MAEGWLDYQTFLKRVQENAGLDTLADAAQVTQAVLETLGERLPRTEREQLAAQLPSELKVLVLRRHPDYPFPLEEFYTRVGGRARTTRVHAVEWSQAVMRALNEAVSQGEMEDVKALLPKEYVALMEGKEEAPQG